MAAEGDQVAPCAMSVVEQRVAWFTLEHHAVDSSRGPPAHRAKRLVQLDLRTGAIDVDQIAIARLDAGE